MVSTHRYIYSFFSYIIFTHNKPFEPTCPIVCVRAQFKALLSHSRSFVHIRKHTHHWCWPFLTSLCFGKIRFSIDYFGREDSFERNTIVVLYVWLHSSRILFESVEWALSVCARICVYCILYTVYEKSNVNHKTVFRESHSLFDVINSYRLIRHFPISVVIVPTTILIRANV